MSAKLPTIEAIESNHRFLQQDFAELCCDAAVLNNAVYGNSNIQTCVENDAMRHNIRSIAETEESPDGLKFAIARSTNALYIAIRGSDNIENWKSNLMFNSPVLIGSRSGKIHQGFWDLANKLPLQYLKHQANDEQIKKIVFTGHSLGGATAAIGALKFMDIVKHKKKVQCITFGAPFFGNKALNKEINRRGEKDHFYHFVGRTDIVPLIMNALSVQLLTSYCPIGHFQVLDKKLDAKQIENHMKKSPTILAFLKIETLQRHMMPYYIKEVSTYWADVLGHSFSRLTSKDCQKTESDSSSETSSLLCTTVRFTSNKAVIGAIDSDPRSLLIEIVGNENVGLLQHLKANDLIFDNAAWRPQNLIVKRKLHSSTKMSYVITLRDFVPAVLPSALVCKFRSRFCTALEQLQIPVSYSPPCRKRRIKDGNILEILRYIHYSINAEVQLKANDPDKLGCEKLMEEVMKKYEEPLKGLDAWLHSALGKLNKKQEEMLKAVIFSDEVGREGISSQERFYKVKKTLKALKKRSWKKMESYWPAIHRTVHKTRKLPTDFFTNLVKSDGFLENESALKTELILATAICLVFDNNAHSSSPEACNEAVSFIATSSYEHLIIKHFKNDLSSISYANLDMKQRIISNLTKGHNKKALAFVKPFCLNAAKLRESLLANDAFTIGIAGQPFSGKSEVTSKNGIFANIPTIRAIEDSIRYHKTCCSDQVNLIEINSRDDDRPDDKMHYIAQTFDAAILFVKAMDNTYTGVKDFVAMINVPIFVCITHADEAIQNRMEELDQRQPSSENESNNDAENYNVAIDDLMCWRRQFCRRNNVHLSNAHFIIPSYILEERAKAQNNKLVVGDSSPIKGIDKLAQWLFDITEEFHELDLNAALQYQFRQQTFCNEALYGSDIITDPCCAQRDDLRSSPCWSGTIHYPRSHLAVQIMLN